MPRVDALFNLRYGHSLELNGLQQVEAPSGVNFVSRAMGNNGVTARVESAATPALAGELSVALGGNGVLSTFVQPEQFVCGRDVMILSEKSPMSIVEKLFWARAIWQNRFRYSYGRQANRTLGSLKLPDEIPSWADEVELPNYNDLAAPIGVAFELPPVEAWKRYKVSDLFDVRSGVYIPAIQKLPGTTPVVTSSARNNGQVPPLDLSPLFPGGVLSVARNGSVGATFYQPRPFFATDDVRVWEAKKGPLTLEEGLFLRAVVELERFRYSYGRKWSLESMRNTVICLPAAEDGSPDWAVISSYVRGLPFTAALSSLL